MHQGSKMIQKHILELVVIMSTVTQRQVLLGLCIELHLQSILKIKCFFEDVTTKIYVDMDLLMKWVFMRRRDSSDKRVQLGWNYAQIASMSPTALQLWDWIYSLLTSILLNMLKQTWKWNHKQSVIQKHEDYVVQSNALRP